MQSMARYNVVACQVIPTISIWDLRISNVMQIARRQWRLCSSGNDFFPRTHRSAAAKWHEHSDKLPVCGRCAGETGWHGGLGASEWQLTWMSATSLMSCFCCCCSLRNTSTLWRAPVYVQAGRQADIIKHKANGIIIVLPWLLRQYWYRLRYLFSFRRPYN